MNHSGANLEALQSSETYSTPADAIAVCMRGVRQMNEENDSHSTGLVDIPDAALVLDPVKGVIIGGVGERRIVRDHKSQSFASVNAIESAQNEWRAELTDCLLVQVGHPTAPEVAAADQAGIRNIIFADVASPEGKDTKARVTDLNTIDIWPYKMNITADFGFAEEIARIYDRYNPIPGSLGALTTNNAKVYRNFIREHTITDGPGTIDHRTLKQANHNASEVADEIENLMLANNEFVTKHEDDDMPLVDIPVVATISEAANPGEITSAWEHTTNLSSGRSSEHAERKAITSKEVELEAKILNKYGQGDHSWPLVRAAMNTHFMRGSLECCAMCALFTMNANVGANWAATLTESQVGKLFRTRKVAQEELAKLTDISMHTPYILERSGKRKHRGSVQRIHRAMSHMERDLTTDRFYMRGAFTAQSKLDFL